MAKRNNVVTSFAWSGIVWRLIAASVLVFITYNPAGYDYFHWAFSDMLHGEFTFDVLKAFAGIVLLIAWVVFLRATSRSLGIGGVILAVAFFGLLMWLIVDKFNLDASNRVLITWIVEIVISGVLAMGMSWSLVRRKISGQMDVDEVQSE